MPRGQLVLLPTALEEVIADDHPVRLVNEILDELDWTEWEATYHGSFGRPPIHPSVMAKVLLFALIRRIRSSRSIEYELKHSIDFIWLASGRRIDVSADRLPAAVRDLKGRREQLAAHMETAKAMDEARQKNGSKGPAQIPKTDTDSRILPNKKGGYAANYTAMVTTGENLTTAEAKNVELIGPLAGRCPKNPDSKRGREVMHDEREGARRRQRERMKRPEAQAAYSRRQHVGEVPFAVIKTRFDMRRFLLRGIEGIGQEWRWASTGFN